MASSHTNLLFHIVFSTKERRPMIVEEFKEELYKYIGGTIRGERGVLLEIGGVADHLHLLAKFRADVSVAEMLRRIKSHSSKWINELGRTRFPFAWQTGYAAFSVSQSQVEKVRDYIRNQEQHHRRESFQEEFLNLLKKHGLEYDERYLWT